MVFADGEGVQYDSENPSLSQAGNGGKNLKTTWVRWVMLFLACNFLIGSYYCFDNPSVLENQMERDLNITSIQWGLFQTVYSVPNMVLPLIGGIMLDTLGIRLGLVVFCLILTIGQFVFAYGGSINSYYTMLAGRTIFGLGGESMTVS